MKYRIPNRFMFRWFALTLVFSTLLSSGVSAAPVDDAKIVINIPSRTLWLYSGEHLVEYYPVGVGRPGFMTPVGQHKVIRMVTNPGWENPYKGKGVSRIRPGGSNPLGTRWIGFKEYKGGEYGIHGTNVPSSVGKFSSHGCVRMRVKDAEALFSKVQTGTPVEVTYDVTLIRQHGDRIQMAVYPDTFKKGMPNPEALKARILKDYPGVTVDMASLNAALKRPTQRYIPVASFVSSSQKPSAPKNTVVETPQP